MKFRLIWRPFKYYMLISIILLSLVGLYLFFSLESFITSQAVSTLETRARLVILELETVDFGPENKAYFNDYAKKINAIAHSHVTIVGANGELLGESSLPQNPMSRPEILGAMAGRVTVDLRLDPDKKETLYVAVPVFNNNGGIKGILVIGKSLSFFSAKRNVITIQFCIFIVVLLTALVLLSYFFSCQYSKPLKDIINQAHRFAIGNFDNRINPPKTTELNDLADSLNTMAETIQKRMDTIVSQSNSLNAILNAMTDAVLAVDANENIIDVNPAALQWLELPREEVEGHAMSAVICHKALQKFIHEAIHNESPKDEDITIFFDNEHVLNVKSSPLFDMHNDITGCVIVFYDVTRIRRLESLRSAFVSNVSHEIRTPLTVIKGSAEILRKSVTNNPDAARFLEIINKHADRLTALINDLLLLSRIEQDASGLARKRQALLAIINKALSAVEIKIQAKGIVVLVDCPPGRHAKVNQSLLEQALINLIDNAVKYSRANNIVEIRVGIANCCCRISVKDYGHGIHRKHFERLFERFYRVDEARSRKEGGTGLGLAIVKHIARVHQGVVEIESEPGRGSTFTIVLPMD